MLEGGERFKFVPFAAQRVVAKELKGKFPRQHSILLRADFSDLNLPTLNKVDCNSCGVQITRETRDLEKSWGHIEKLTYVVPEVPQLVCGCRLFIEADQQVGERLRPVMRIVRTIQSALEASSSKNLVGLLDEEDIRKVKDFIDNRWVHPASATARLRERNLRRN